MPIRTMVAVLLRGADGTVDQRGTATLLAPTQLIVHPPFNDRFAADPPEPGDLSVCVATWVGDAPVAEQIAVTRLGVADQPFVGPDGQDITIVALELEHPSTAPPLVIDRTQDAIAAHLADPFDGAAVLDTRKHTSDPNIVCQLTGMWC